MLHMPQEVARDLLSYCIDNIDHDTWNISEEMTDTILYQIPNVQYSLFTIPVIVNITLNLNENEIYLVLFRNDINISFLRLSDEVYVHYMNHLLDISINQKAKYLDTIPFTSLVQAEQESICHLLYRLSDQSPVLWNKMEDVLYSYTVTDDVTVKLITRDQVFLKFKDFTVSVKTDDLPEFHSTTINTLYDVAHQEITCENTTDIIQMINKAIKSLS